VRNVINGAANTAHNVVEAIKYNAHKANEAVKETAKNVVQAIHKTNEVHKVETHDEHQEENKSKKVVVVHHKQPEHLNQTSWTQKKDQSALLGAESKMLDKLD